MEFIELEIINDDETIGMDVHTGEGTTDHSKLKNLDYEHSGHTGFQKEINSNNKVASDLIDDTQSNNKFVTNQEKQAWNNKSDFSGDYNDLLNKLQAGTGIEITPQNEINNTSPNKIISITVDQQTMELDKTAGEINSLIEQGYLILLMGRLMFIEEYDSSRDKLYAYFYSGGYATKLTITGNQVTDYESLDVVYDNHYNHTDNNYTDAEKNKLAGLENKVITVNADPQTMVLDKSADEIENYLNNGYIVMALGYQVFRKDYNASTHTIQLAIYFGEFGQVITVTGNQVTNVNEYYYASDHNYVHTDNNFSNYYKDKLDNAPEVVDLSNYRVGDTITDSALVSQLMNDRSKIKYGTSIYSFATIMGTGYIYTVMNSLTAGAYITLNYDSNNNAFYFYEVGTAPWENPDNKVTSLSSSSTDTEYPSAKCVYKAVVGNEVTFQIPASAWSEPSGNNFYNTVAIVTLPPNTFTDNCTLELLNYEGFQYFAKHGFVLYGYEVESQRIWITAHDKPTSSLYLKMMVYNYE